MKIKSSRFFSGLLCVFVGVCAAVISANRSDSHSVIPFRASHISPRTAEVADSSASLVAQTLPLKKSVPTISPRVATIAPTFASRYSVRTLLAAPGVIGSYGGLSFQLGSANTLLIGGGAETSSGKLYSIKVVRGAGKKITGFTGTATVLRDAPYNDAGLFYGPNSVLFFSRYPVNEIAQIKLGSFAPNKIIPLSPFGVSAPVSGFNIIPFGFTTAGKVKLVVYSSGTWYEGSLSADRQGTYNLTSVIAQPTSNLLGGSGNFSYVPPGSPLFSQPSLLVNEYSTGKVAAYRVNTKGDPLPTTRQDFLTGVSGVWGSTIDPQTGDLLVMGFGSGAITIVSGFKAPPLPSITSFTPTSGSVGTTVTVSGANFTPGTAVRLNGKAVAAKIVSRTQLTFKVPNGVTSGKVSVLGAGIPLTSSTADFNVL